MRWLRLSLPVSCMTPRGRLGGVSEFLSPVTAGLRRFLSDQNRYCIYPTLVDTDSPGEGCADCDCSLAISRPIPADAPVTNARTPWDPATYTSHMHKKLSTSPTHAFGLPGETYPPCSTWALLGRCCQWNNTAAEVMMTYSHTTYLQHIHTYKQIARIMRDRIMSTLP